MKVVIRLDVPDIARRALRARCGQSGLATRSEISSLVDMMLDHDLADAIADLNATIARKAAEAANAPPYAFRRMTKTQIAKLAPAARERSSARRRRR